MAIIGVFHGFTDSSVFLVLVQQSSQLNVSSKDKLTVTFTFFCTDDNGKKYEPYGYLGVQVENDIRHTVYYVKESNAGKVQDVVSSLPNTRISEHQLHQKCRED